MVTTQLQPAQAASSQRSLFSASNRRAVLLSLALVAVVVALYAPVHGYPFFSMDDDSYVTLNPHIQNGLHWTTVKWAFTHAYAHNWHPLTWMSHALDIQMFQSDPAGHHDMNVALHALDAVLLFWILLRATGYMGRSFMVAALFALHPANVESVAWIAERKTMLSMLFFLLALGAYRWYARQPQVGRYAVVTLLFILGLMAKPQIITFPFVLLLWDYWPLQRMFAADQSFDPRRDEAIPPRSFSSLIKEKIPLFVICVVDAALTCIAQHVGSPDQWPYTFSIRLGNAIVSYARYVGMALWPSQLAILYPHPGSSLASWQIWASFLLLLTITALVIAGRRHRYLVVGWFWFLGSLVPMIGVLQVYVQAMADRYAYNSFVGLFIMVCWGAADWARHRVPRAAVWAASAAVLLALTATTHRQIGYWKDDVSVWSRCLRVTQHNYVAEFGLGNALQAVGKTKEAVPHFFRAAAINPADIATNLAIADYEQQQGNVGAAIDYYKKVLGISKNARQNQYVLFRMGHAYQRLGDTAQAEECFTAAAHAVPAKTFDWQGDWWRNILPLVRDYFRGEKDKPSRE